MPTEIRRYVRSLGLDAYVVGGAVRDELLGIDHADEDFLVPGVDHAGLRILVGAESLPYVEGSTIDFTTTPHEGFVVDNPNAVAGCGCGSSFVMRDDAR